MSDQVNHPKHYGDKDSPYEVIKIAEHYNTDLYIFNLLKYCLRAGLKSKETEIQDLEKGLWYLQRKIDRLKQKDLTINIKCENNISSNIGEMHDKVLDIKKELSEDELAIEEFINANKQDIEDQFKPFVNPFEPKLISELKVGDKIKAIDQAGGCLIIGKLYTINRIYTKLINLEVSEVAEGHTFSKSDLDKYFLVTHLNKGLEDNKKKWHDDVSPKLISELKVGDEIKAIDDLYMDGCDANLCLIKDKHYIIKDIVRGVNITIASEYDKNHYFKLSDLDKYFHVSKE